MAITIASGVDLSCSAEWGKLLSCSPDDDTAVACSAFASFLASKGFKISKIDQVPPSPPPSKEIVARGALALKRAAEPQKRPLASIEELEEEISTDEELEAAKPAQKRQKLSDSSLATVDKILTALQGVDVVDRVRFPAGGASPWERACRKAALRSLGLNSLPADVQFSNCTLGDDGWLASIGVPKPRRTNAASTVARIATVTAERLHACGGGSGAVKEMTVSWRDGSSKHHGQVWAWTGKALAERAAVCREMTASEVSQIRVCKGCGKVQSVHCGCMLVSGSLPLP
jgi:hypothetical protein